MEGACDEAGQTRGGARVRLFDNSVDDEERVRSDQAPPARTAPASGCDSRRSLSSRADTNTCQRTVGAAPSRAWCSRSTRGFQPLGTGANPVARFPSRSLVEDRAWLQTTPGRVRLPGGLSRSPGQISKAAWLRAKSLRVQIPGGTLLAPWSNSRTPDSESGSRGANPRGVVVEATRFDALGDMV